MKKKKKKKRKRRIPLANALTFYMKKKILYIL